VIIKKIHSGHAIVEVSLPELMKFGTIPPSCDGCATRISSNSVYIPVLHSTYCNVCFAEWEKHAIYYEEDREYESERLEWVCTAIASSMEPGERFEMIGELGREEAGIINKMYKIGSNLGCSMLRDSIGSFVNFMRSVKPNYIPQLDIEYRYFMLSILQNIESAYYDDLMKCLFLEDANVQL